MKKKKMGLIENLKVLSDFMGKTPTILIHEESSSESTTFTDGKEESKSIHSSKKDVKISLDMSEKTSK